MKSLAIARYQSAKGPAAARARRAAVAAAALGVLIVLGFSHCRRPSEPTLLPAAGSPPAKGRSLEAVAASIPRPNGIRPGAPAPGSP